MLISFRFMLLDVKYKPVSHKLKRPHQIVNHAKHILPILLDGGKGSNEIFLKGQQTGLTSYKKDVLNTIKTLQQAELIDEIPDPKHSQKRIKQLTPLGRGLTELMQNIESYNESYSKLSSAIIKNFSFDWSKIKDDSVLRNILRGRGWAEDDISHFINAGKQERTGVHDFASISPWSVLRILLAKYSVFIFDYKPNQKAKFIIDKIIIELMAEQLFSILDNVTNIRRQSMLHDIINYIVGNIEHQIFGLGRLFKGYRFMDEHIENVILATFSILGPDREFIKREIDSLEFNIMKGPDTDYNRTFLDEQRKVVRLLEKVLAKSP